MEKMLATFLKALGITPEYIEQTVKTYTEIADNFDKRLNAIDRKIGVVEDQQKEMLELLRENRKKSPLKLVDKNDEQRNAVDAI